MSGRRILKAIIAGETNAMRLTELGSTRLKCSRSELAAALDGRVTTHHRFLIDHHLGLIEELERHISAFDARIGEVLAPFRDTVERLITTPGVGRGAAEVILAEIGPDMSALLTAGHLLSWAGVVPRLDESAGKHRLHCKRSVEVGASTGRLRDVSFANLFAAVYSFQAGDWVATQKYSERGAAVFAELGDRFRGQTCLIFLAHHAIATGQYHEARRILDNLGDVTLSIENAPGQAWALSARLLLDLTEGAAPAGSLAAVERINGEDLHHAERLLCGGLIALAHLRLGRIEPALEAADQGLRGLMETTPTMGILTHSISAIGEVYLQLWRERLASGGSLADLQNKAGIACREFRAFARRTRNARPRASWVFGCYAIQSGRPGSAIRYWRRSAKLAQRLSMPLERALALDALGRHLAEGATDREACREESRRIFQRLGIGLIHVETRSIAA